MTSPITIGSEVTANRADVVARTEDNSIIFVNEGEKLIIEALGCGLALCRRPKGLALLSIQTADLKPWLE